LIVVAQIGLWIGGGFRLKEGGYLILGLLQVGAMMIYYTVQYRAMINPSVFVLGAGLLLFATGVIVTFNKQRILGWYARWSKETTSGKPELSEKEPSKADQRTEIPRFVVFPGQVEKPGSLLQRGKFKKILINIFRKDLGEGIELKLPFTSFLWVNSEMKPGLSEQFIVCVHLPNENLKDWRIFITSQRLILRFPDRWRLSILYGQIVSIMREDATLIIVGHSSETIVCPQLTRHQARALKKAIEDFLDQVRQPLSRH
jgi:hypothetical protein